MMYGLMRKAVAALVAGSALVAAATPADAQRFRGGGYHRGYYGGGYGYRGYGYRYHGGRTGVAIGAGLIGLGVGAAIASANRPYYGGYYGGPRYYGGGPGYYGGYYGDCYARWQWDPYIGRSVRVQTCY